MINEKLTNIGASKFNMKVISFLGRYIDGKSIDGRGNENFDIVGYEKKKLKTEDFDIQVLKNDSQNLYQHAEYFILEIIHEDIE